MNNINNLTLYRRKRNFNVLKYLNAKSIIINNHMLCHNLDTCVVGISGGIDSAVVLGILVYASKIKDSVIKKIIGVNIPIFSNGVSCNQDDTFNKTLELKERYPTVEFISIDVSNIYSRMNELISDCTNIISNNWASGQLVSNIRVPIIYYVDTLFYKINNNAIVCGTINKDEGGYIGYFGKASDSVVDVQIISDIHKSEVYKLAKYLKIPESIINAKPNGDIYNQLCDEDFLGIKYDFIELYTAYLCKDIIPVIDKEWEELSAKMEYYHTKCIHKYYMPGMALNLSVYDHNIPYKEFINKMDLNVISKFVNCKNIEYELTNKDVNSTTHVLNNVQIINNVLEEREIEILLKRIINEEWIKSDIHGKIITDKKLLGSYRLSWYNKNFANNIWNRIKEHIDNYIINDDIETNDNCRVWRIIGINPLFRFIKYNNNDSLVPHYDSTYKYDSNIKSFKSIIIYLTNNNSGETCFIKEKENKNNYDDWDNNELDTDIIFKINPLKGSLAIFDHNILHSSKKIENEEKIIIRTDLMYEKCYNYPNKFNTEPIGIIRNNDDFIDDDYYNLAGKYYTKEELIEAGYMNTKRKNKVINFNFLGTPYNKINIDFTKKKHTLLFSTGCYNPLHEDHILSMEIAKKYCEDNDENIIGGYFVIANTSYIKTKVKEVNIIDLIRKNEITLKDNNWLMIDPYECLYENNDINFTDVLNRLYKYIYKNFNINFTIKYVFGGDNSNFAKAFISKGNCICVERPGFEEISNITKNDNLIKNNKNIVFLKKEHNKFISSRIIRNESKSIDNINNINNDNKNYIINEDSNCEKNDIYEKDSILKFNEDLFEIMKVYIKNCNFIFNKTVINKVESNDISLYSYYETKYNLKISRLFNISTYYSEPNIINKPNYENIEKQIKSIPIGKYNLIDDDTYTGNTIRVVKELLNKNNIEIEKCIFLNKYQNILDIMDCRDLLIGRSDGGLFIKLPNNKICRCPYLLPYVYPSSRTSIDSKDDLDFSLRLWKLNYIFYKNKKIYLKDITRDIQELLLYCGFNLDHPMSYICKYHILYLE